jgi:pimeloyl-ACP methyl ester carboxylesterase
MEFKVGLMPYVLNQETRIYYEVEGLGKPLVLAHGISASLEDWREVGWVEALRDHFKLILIDARGHGRSDKPHEPSAYRQIHQVNDWLAVLDDIGVDKAHFLGFSMGGNVSLGVGIHAPDRCLSLMMGGIQPYARDERRDGIGLSTPKPFRGIPDGNDPIKQLMKDGGEAWAAFIEANMEVSTNMKKRLMGNDFEALIARFEVIHESGLSGYLGSVQMPCLIYMGEDDPNFGGAKQLADSLPRAEFVSFPGLHHFEMFTAVGLILPEILRFLSITG